MSETYIACLDFGGTSIKTGLCKKDGTIIKKTSYVIPKDRNTFIETIKNHIQGLQKEYCIEGIAISSCGVVHCESGYIDGFSTIPYIHGPNWKEIIYEQTGLHCEIENDANCAALSEVFYGKAKHIKNMAFIVIGSGVGGAIVIDRKIYHGPNLYGGEFGLMLMPKEQDLDEEGTQGAGSDSLSDFSLVASTSSMAKKMNKIQPGEWDGIRVFEEAEKGNKDCEHVIEVFYDNIAHAVFNIQHMLDPEMILFGGGISARPDFKEQVMKAYEKLIKRIYYKPLIPNIECCTYLQDANLLGALAHYLQLRP